MPIGVYGDGVAVGMEMHRDSVYVIYIYFPHRGVREQSKLNSKHIFTCYRKSQATKETLDDIWDVLVWELQALALGREPKLGEQIKSLDRQEPGEFLCGDFGRTHRFCLMQFKGDMAYLVDAWG